MGGNQKPHSHKAETDEITDEYVAQGREGLTSFEKLYVFSGKGRKSCITAEDTGKQKEPEFIADSQSLKVSPEQSDQKTANQVGRQSLIGKSGVGERFDGQRGQVPAGRADCSPKCHRENFDHSRRIP